MYVSCEFLRKSPAGIDTSCVHPSCLDIKVARKQQHDILVCMKAAEMVFKIKSHKIAPDLHRLKTRQSFKGIFSKGADVVLAHVSESGQKDNTLKKNVLLLLVELSTKSKLSTKERHCPLYNYYGCVNFLSGFQDKTGTTHFWR